MKRQSDRRSKILLWIISVLVIISMVCGSLILIAGTPRNPAGVVLPSLLYAIIF